MRFLNFVFVAVSILSLTGCDKYEFSIYSELQLSENDIVNSRYIEFLKDIEVGGISYSDDKLTPDLINGKLFGDRNLSKVEVTRYFKYSMNRTFDHRSSIFVELHPNMIKYVRGYFDESARVEQIKSYRPPVIIRPKREVVAKRRRSSDDMLPKGLLPPRLPDLSIGVETPNVPDL